MAWHCYKTQILWQGFRQGPGETAIWLHSFWILPGITRSPQARVTWECLPFHAWHWGCAAWRLEPPTGASCHDIAGVPRSTGVTLPSWVLRVWVQEFQQGRQKLACLLGSASESPRVPSTVPCCWGCHKFKGRGDRPHSIMSKNLGEPYLKPPLWFRVGGTASEEGHYIVWVSDRTLGDAVLCFSSRTGGSALQPWYGNWGPATIGGGPRIDLCVWAAVYSYWVCLVR